MAKPHVVLPPHKHVPVVVLPPKYLRFGVGHGPFSLPRPKPTRAPNLALPSTDLDDKKHSWDWSYEEKRSWDCDWLYGDWKHSWDWSSYGEKHSCDWSYGDWKHSWDWSSYGEKHSWDWSYGEKHPWDWSYGEKRSWDCDWSYGEKHSWDWSYGDDLKHTWSDEEEDDFEFIVEEDPSSEELTRTKEILHHQEAIKTTERILKQYESIYGCYSRVQHHRGEQVLRSGKRHRSPPCKTSRKKRSRRRVKARNTTGFIKLCINDLRYSQESVKRVFSCGRSIRELVYDLMSGKVRLSAPFLRLTVFETEDDSGLSIYRCIDNRRLKALKWYATTCGKTSMMVNVNLHTKEAFHDYQRFVQNTDQTPGYNVRVRPGATSWKKGEKKVANKKRRQRPR